MIGKFNCNDAAWTTSKLDCNDVAQQSSKFDCDANRSNYTKDPLQKDCILQWDCTKLVGSIATSLLQQCHNEQVRLRQCLHKWASLNHENDHKLAMLLRQWLQKIKVKLWSKTWQSTFKFAFWSWKQGCPGVSATQCLFACLTNPHCHICNNHLRNVWFGGTEKSLTKRLNKILQSSLDKIDSTLCVTLSTSAIIRAIDKELSLLANYPKGHGELFLEWMRENYSGAFLFHVKHAVGSCQDLCMEGSLAFIMH